MSLQSNAVFQGKDNVSTTLKTISKNQQQAFKSMRDEAKKTNSTLGDIKKGIGGLNSALGDLKDIVGLAFGGAVVSQFASEVGALVAEGAKLEGITSSFERLSEGKINLKAVSDTIGGTVSEMRLMEQTNKALQLGLPATTAEMSRMALVGQVLGQALGRTSDEGLDDLVTGLGRGSAQILDNIGVIVDANEAHKAYADQIGVSVSALDSLQKKQAVYNAAMTAAEAKIGSLGLEVSDQKVKVEALAASWGNLRDSLAGLTATIATSGSGGGFLKGLTDGLASWVKGTDEALKGDTFAMLKEFQESGLLNNLDGLKGEEITPILEKVASLNAQLTEHFRTHVEELDRKEQRAKTELEITRESLALQQQIAAMKIERPTGPFKEEPAGPIDAPVFQFDPAMKELELELGQLELNQKLEMASAVQVMGDAMGYSASVQQQAMAIQRQHMAQTGQEITVTQALAAARRQANDANLAAAGAIAGQMRTLVGENTKAAKAIAAVQGVIELARAYGAFASYQYAQGAMHLLSSATYFKVAGSSSGGSGGRGGGAGTTRSNFNALSSASSKDNDRGTIVINNNFDENGWNTTIDERSKTAVAMDIHRNNGPVSVALGGG